MKVLTKYLKWNAIIAIICCIVSWLVFKYLLPMYTFPYVWLVLCFFIVCQLGMNILVRKTRRNPKQLPMMYMVIKAVKFIALVIIAVVYCATIKLNIKSFLVSFAVLYIVWLCFDTAFFTKYQKELIAETAEENNDKKNA